MDPTTDRFLLKACVRCGGDLTLDEGDWRCLQCGRYYYRRATVASPPHWREWLGREWLRRPLPGDGSGAPGQEAGFGGGQWRPAPAWVTAALTSG